MNVEEILLAAVEKKTEAERAAFLEGACGPDAELRSQVDGLLRAHCEAGSFLEQPLFESTPTAEQPPVQEKSGSVIGPYKLLQQIGEGGMGTVFMAEQTQPVQRKVALKIIKPGMDSRQIIARFEAERQALAMMDHVNIARVLDAGATEAGRPYFVMELVHGVPITTYCDDNQLTPRERLELFVPVCQAIQHAHQKGIIHRDIKPSNVMVTLYEGKPVPKVIDFGVAKATEQRLTERTLFTQYGTMVGTLEYMSPEQAEMSAQGTDTRSDIYSLGVLLYELLTGSTPLDRKRVKEAAYAEILRMIKEEEPPKPSTRMSDSGEALASISAQRKTEPAKLSKLMRGELDWIVMKCLEKDRNRRYETASGFAMDVQRYLNDEPVQACPPSAWYRFRKFARRNKAALATAALLATALALGGLGGGATWLWQRAEAAHLEAADARDAAESAFRQEHQARAGEAEARRKLAVVSYLHKVQLAHHAWADNDLLRAGLLLDRCPEELRHWEWHHVHRLCHSELLTLRGHVGAVSSVAYSPDGLHLVSTAGSTSSEQVVRVWDPVTGGEIRAIRPGGEADEVTFSKDCQHFAAWIPAPKVNRRSVGGELKVGNLASGQVTFTVKVPGWDTGPTMVGVAFSADGKRVASRGFIRDARTMEPAGGEVKVWDLAASQEIFARKMDVPLSDSVAFSPDASCLVAGGRLRDAQAGRNVASTITVWNLASGEEILRLRPLPLGSQYAFSPDSKRLVTWSHNEAKKVVWDLATRQETFTLKSQGPVTFTPDGRCLASIAEDGTLKLWDQATGQEVRSLKGATANVSHLAFSPDGKRLAGCGEKTIRVWDLATGGEILAIKGHVEGITCVAFSPDGRRLVTGSADRTIRVWDAAEAPEPRTIEVNRGIPFGIMGVAYSPDGRRLATAGGDNVVKVWDAETGQEVQALRGHTDVAWSVAFSPDGRHLASGSFDLTVKIWDLASGKETLTLKGHRGYVSGIAYSPDGRRLATAGGSDRTVKVWDADTGQELFTIGGYTGTVHVVAFSPDGRQLAVASDEKVVKVWDAATGQLTRSLEGHTKGLRGVAFSPDGRRLASASNDATVRVWDLATGREYVTLYGHTSGVEDVAFSPDGMRLAGGSGDEVRLWDLLTGEETLALLTDGVMRVAFSPDGRQLAAAVIGYPPTASVKLWHAPSLPARPPGPMVRSD